MEWAEYKKKIGDALDAFEFDGEIVPMLREARKKERTVFVAGNGGSAALASHYACDLSKFANKDWKSNKKRLRVVNLACDVGYMTAISNDEGYEEVFVQQLANLAKANDVLVLISSSGNSPNIVRAAEYAKKEGIAVIGICGFGGGRLKELADHCAHMKNDSYQVCEDVHHVFGHFLALCLREF